jgi:hypothetical protein
MKDDASRDSFLRPSPQILKKFVDQVFLYSGQQVCVDDSQAASKFLKILVERIVRASTYVHQPPTFLSTQDWRFTEYPPAGHALTTALIEVLKLVQSKLRICFQILASKYTIPQVIDGFLELVIRQPMVRLTNFKKFNNLKQLI